MTHCIVTGLEFANSREMEEAYGLDSPEQLRAESEWYAEMAAEEEAELTAAFGPAVLRPVYVNDNIPF